MKRIILLLFSCILLTGCSKKSSAIATIKIVEESSQTQSTLDELKGIVGPSVSVEPVLGTRLFILKTTTKDTSDALSSIKAAVSKIENSFKSKNLIIVDPPTAVK